MFRRTVVVVSRGVGIYLDDFASGTIVENNLLVNTIRGIVIGGGRDNQVAGNVIVNSIAPIQLDARGLTWASDHITGEKSRIVALCKSVLEKSPIYGERYPQLLSFLQSEPAKPLGNILRSNTFNDPAYSDWPTDRWCFRRERRSLFCANQTKW